MILGFFAMKINMGKFLNMFFSMVPLTLFINDKWPTIIIINQMSHEFYDFEIL